MGKIVTYPPEKHAGGKQMTRGGIKTEMDREILARILVENVARWIDDDDRDEIVNMDLPRGPSKRLTVEEAEEMAKRGEGTFGHTTVIEPVDLELYESYMYPPLTMPDKPEVMVSYWDMNRGPVNFMEGRVMVKAKCPDGIESWLVISVPVPNFYTAVEGNVWGWPKYVCDEMTVEHDRSEIIYEGNVRLSMDFTPGGVDDETIQQLRDRGTEGGNTCSFHVKGGGMQLIRQGRGGPRNPADTYFAEWEPGMIKTYFRPEDRHAGLIPEDCVTPGVWQRSIRLGGGTSGMMKVKSTPAK